MAEGGGYRTWRLGGLQNAEDYRRPAHLVQASARRSNGLTHARSEAEETAELIEPTAKSSTHRPHEGGLGHEDVYCIPEQSA